MKKASFWEKLVKPFSVLAPMEEVTDVAFRQTMLMAGRPEVFFTEFTSVEGIVYQLDRLGVKPLGDRVVSDEEKIRLRRILRENPVMRRLVFEDNERPVVAQIWGKDPGKFLKAARWVGYLGFDGIDINMGCPDRAVLKQGSGAALCEQRGLVGEIVKAVKEGGGGLPVSVKTRLGNRKREEGWIEFLLGLDLAAVTVHGRTAKEMSLVPADWEAIGRVVRARDELGVRTLVIGNGDIKSLADGRIRASGVDGVMVGRGVFENPWVFGGVQAVEKLSTQRLELLKTHLRWWERYWREEGGGGGLSGQAESGCRRREYLKDYSIMKRFFKMYVRDFEGASELRAKLMETKQVDEALGLLS